MAQKIFNKKFHDAKGKISFGIYSSIAFSFIYKKPPEMDTSKNTNDEKKFYIRDKNYFIF
ncbi:hypothetical protein [Chryseobacterium sp. Marseille-Q8038]